MHSPRGKNNLDSIQWSDAGPAGFDLRPRPPAVRPGVAGRVAARRGRRGRRASIRRASRSTDEQIAAASLVAFYLPMHTATRLAAPLIDRVRGASIRRRGCAPTGCMRRSTPRGCGEQGVDARARARRRRARTGRRWSTARLPAQARELADGQSRRHARGFTSSARSLGAAAARRATRRCRCPTASRAWSAAPTRRAAASTCAGTVRSCRSTQGQFRVVPVDVVHGGHPRAGRRGRAAHHVRRPGFLQRPDARAPHRRARRARVPRRHLRRHDQDRAPAGARDMLPLLRETGCLFITSAVESVDDEVLVQLQKGHTRADFGERSALCRAAGRHAVPTFVPFTPWTTLDGLRRPARGDRGARSGRAGRADSARHPAARDRAVARCSNCRTSARRSSRSMPRR